MTVEKTIEQKSLEMPQEAKQAPKIPRRGFLKVLATALGVAGASMVGLSLRERRAAQAQASGELESLETTEEILAFIKENYGIEIPNKVSEEYSEEVYIRTPQGERKLDELKPNALLSSEEAEIAAGTLWQIPGVGYLVQLMIPFRSKEEAGSSYMGYQWPAYLHSDSYEEFPRDRLVSDRAAIKLILPEGAKMTDPLPVVGEEYSNAVLTPLLQMSLNSAGVKANTRTEIPWTTQGERFKQVITHEFGHALLDQALLASSEDMKEYWQRKNLTLYNMNTLDVDNPLLMAFAQVNGWKKVSYADFVRQYSPEESENLAANYPESAQTLVWDKDVAVWGNLENRKMRITPYASYGPIQEAFCEYWMTSILYPNLLTPKEREFFGKLHQGLAENPASFIKSIVDNKVLG